MKSPKNPNYMKEFKEARKAHEKDMDQELQKAKSAYDKAKQEYKTDPEEYYIAKLKYNHLLERSAVKKSKLVSKARKDIEAKQTHLVKISPAQALLTLIEKHKDNKPKADRLKKLLLSGVDPEEFKQFEQEFKSDSKLSHYVISADIETINEDPAKRHFETHLAFHTLRDTLNKLDENTINEYYQIIASYFSSDNLKDVPAYVDGMLEGKPPERDMTDLNVSPDLFSEYKQAIYNIRLNLTEEKSSFSPSQVRKMELLLKCSCLTTVAMGAMPSAFPLNIYTTSPLFEEKNRGNIPKLDQQAVTTRAMGTMKDYMPLQRDSISYSATVRTKPSDKSDVVKESKWMQQSAELLVHPFVNSISGTLLCQLRMIKSLEVRHGSFMKTAFGDVSSFANYIKCYVSLMLYQSGGHSLHEFISLLAVPKVKEEFQFMHGFDQLNLETLFFANSFSVEDKSFKTETVFPFELALRETMEYNQLILQRALLDTAFESKTQVGQDKADVLAKYRHYILNLHNTIRQDIEKLSSAGSEDKQSKIREKINRQVEDLIKKLLLLEKYAAANNEALALAIDLHKNISDFLQSHRPILSSENYRFVYNSKLILAALYVNFAENAVSEKNYALAAKYYQQASDLFKNDEEYRKYQYHFKYCHASYLECMALDAYQNKKYEQAKIFCYQYLEYMAKEMVYSDNSYTIDVIPLVDRVENKIYQSFNENNFFKIFDLLNNINANLHQHKPSTLTQESKTAVLTHGLFSDSQSAVSSKHILDDANDLLKVYESYKLVLWGGDVLRAEEVRMKFMTIKDKLKIVYQNDPSPENKTQASYYIGLFSQILSIGQSLEVKNKLRDETYEFDKIFVELCINQQNWQKTMNGEVNSLLPSALIRLGSYYLSKFEIQVKDWFQGFTLNLSDKSLEELSDCQKNLESARQYFERALKLNPDFPAIEKNLDYCERMLKTFDDHIKNRPSLMQPPI